MVELRLLRSAGPAEEDELFLMSSACWPSFWNTAPLERPLVAPGSPPEDRVVPLAPLSRDMPEECFSSTRPPPPPPFRLRRALEHPPPSCSLPDRSPNLPEIHYQCCGSAPFWVTWIRVRIRINLQITSQILAYLSTFSRV